MTTLRERKSPLRIMTSTAIRGRLLVIELHPTHPHSLYIRESRSRHGYWVPFVAVYECGAKIAAREMREIKSKVRQS